MLRLLPNIECFGGIPGPEAYQIKKQYAERWRFHRNKFTSKSEVFPTWAPLPNPNKMIKLAFQKYKLSNSFIKLQLQNWETVFFQTSIFKFYLLSPISALLLPTCSTSRFQKLVEKNFDSFWKNEFGALKKALKK